MEHLRTRAAGPSASTGRSFRWAATALLLVAGTAAAAIGDTEADRVFGQPGMNWNATHNDATGVDHANGVAVDRTRNIVWVIDWLNSRVLGWNNTASYTAGGPADYILGQPDATSSGCNTGGVSATSLCNPSGITADSRGNLYVADEINHRVLEFDAPIATHAAASRVFGQPGFTTADCNGTGLDRNTLCSPGGVATDDAGNVYVADWDNHRVLEYDLPLSTDLLADRVYGQPDFRTGDCNTGGIGPATLCHPSDVAVTRNGNTVFIADFINNRVLQYNDAASGDTRADRVYGRPNYTETTCDKVASNKTNLCAPVALGVDGVGRLYVADNSNRVLQFNRNGGDSDLLADRVYGQTDLSGTGCNAGGLSASTLCNPTGIAFDNAGNLYVSDFDNNRALEYDVPNPDTTPSPFSFTSKTGVPLAKFVLSNAIVIHGTNAPSPVSVSGGDYRLYDGSAWGAWTHADGSIAPAQKVQLRQKSAATPSTATTITLTVGGVDGSFTVTTAP